MSLTVQLFTMLSMIGMGVWMGVALDTYHRFLKRSKRNRMLVFVYDLLFWFVQALLIFYVLLLVNEAEARVYVFLALLCGFAAYQSLFRRLYLFVLETIIIITVRTYHICASLFKILIIKPIMFLGTCTITIFFFLLRMLRSFLLGLYRVIKHLAMIIWKIFFTPFRLIGMLVWKVLPNRVKIFVKSFAGFLLKVEKLKVILVKLWKSIKNFLGGPRQ